MFIVWELTQAARNQKGDKGGRGPRLSDQAEFMSRLMFDFNREIARYLREDLGCRQLINAGNWRSADQVILDDAERWSYTANEVIAKNHYFQGLHKGPNAGWQIRAGQVYTSKSFTTTPQSSATVRAPGSRSPVHHLGGLVGTAVAVPVRGAGHRRRTELLDRA